MSFVFNLDTDTFIDLIKKALEKETEDKLWEKWLVQMPHMEHPISFNDYKDKHFKNVANESGKTDEELLEDAERILKSMSRPD